MNFYIFGFFRFLSLLLGPPPSQQPRGPSLCLQAMGYKQNNRQAVLVLVPVVNLDVSSESCTKGLCISTPNLKGSCRRSVLFFGEHGRLLFFKLKLNHVEATSC